MTTVAVPSTAGKGPTISEGSAEIVARLERVPITGFHTRARLTLGTCTFFDGFDSLSLGYVLAVLVPMWKINPADTGLLISIGYASGFLGAIAFGAVAERWGRMPSLLISVAMFGVFTFLCGLAQSFQQLFWFRVLAGFALAGEVPVGAAYIGELAHAHGRGFFFLVYEFTFAIGMVLVALISTWVIPNLGWQWMFFIGAIPALITIVLRMQLPESPRWLANQGRYKEADTTVKKIEMEATGGDLSKLPPLVVKPVTAQATRWQELFQGIYLGRTLLMLAFYFCIYFTNFSLVQWTPTIYTTILKIPAPQALEYATITQFVGLAGTFVCALTIDAIGRRTAFIGSFLIAAVTELALWLMGVRSAEQMLVMVTIAYFFISYLSISMLLYVPELFPTRLRALSSGLGMSGNRVGSVVAPIAVAAVISSLGLSSVFLMYGVVLVIGLVVAVLFCVETKQKVLEELAP